MNYLSVPSILLSNSSKICSHFASTFNLSNLLTQTQTFKMTCYCANYYVKNIPTLSYILHLASCWSVILGVHKLPQLCPEFWWPLYSMSCKPSKSYPPTLPFIDDAMKSMQVNNTGALVMQNGVSQVSEHWVENAKREQLRREEESARKNRVRTISTRGSR